MGKKSFLKILSFVIFTLLNSIPPLSHTSQSTALFFEKKRNETGIEAVPFKCIPPKFPDVFPVDYCAFLLLKRTLFKWHPKTLDGLWKIVKEKWSKIILDGFRNSFFA